MASVTEIVNDYLELARQSSSPLTTQHEAFIEINQIRIMPGNMIFANAYDGKTYEKRIRIKNCGTSTASVRILHPTSQVFRIDPLPEGQSLMAGLSITRKISFTFCKALPVFSGSLPICINGKWNDYKLLVHLSVPEIAVSPDTLDFGRMDTDNAAASRKLVIKNTGTKGTLFNIDLGRNHLELVVEPMKGSVAANSSTTVIVEIFGSQLGLFKSEFWISFGNEMEAKSVTVVGCFYLPKLKIDCFYSNSFDFAIVDFPRTYYGARSGKSLVIKNCTSHNCMFGVFGIVKGSILPLSEAVKLDDNFEHFDIKPIEGRLFSNRASAAQINFLPKLVKGTDNKKRYALCFLKIIRINWEDLRRLPAHFEELPREEDMELDVSKLSLFTEIEGSLDTKATEFFNRQEIFGLEPYQNICLHGPIQEANVKLRPNHIYLTNLVLQRIYDREVLIENQSSYLSIIVHYEKTSSIEVTPKEVVLKSGKCVEVKVSIRPAKLGKIDTKIKFRLLYPDFPKNSKVREVGYITLGITFDTTDVAHVAKIRVPPYLEGVSKILKPKPSFTQTKSQLQLKIRNDKYYLDYIRRCAKQRKIEEIQCLDYDLTNIKLKMLEGIKFTDYPIAEEIERAATIPLTPLELHKIEIGSKYFKFRVCSHCEKEKELEIYNKNDFPIRVYLKSTKPWVSFQGGPHLIIKSKECKTTGVLFYAMKNIGRINSSIDIVVNESHSFNLFVLGYVIPKVVKLKDTKIEFLEGEGNYKIIELKNTLNIPIQFQWVMPNSSLNACPSDGMIPAFDNLLTVVTITPDPDLIGMTECRMISESGYQQVIQVTYRMAKYQPEVLIDSSFIDFGKISLNTPETKIMTLRNYHKEMVVFKVANPEPIAGLCVTPTKGFIRAKCDEQLKITAHFKNCVHFSTEILLSIHDDTFNIIVAVKGSVAYPKISFDPQSICFRKTSAFSCDQAKFTVKNTSKSDCCINFPLENFAGFTIKEYAGFKDTVENLRLAPSETQKLYLIFRPTDTVSYSFFLPYVINGILGPPLANSNDTIYPNYFLPDSDKELPELSKIRVTTCVSDEIIKFSCLKMDFIYYGEDHESNNIKEKLEISNASQNPVQISLKVDNINDPFSVSIDKNIQSKFSERSCNFEIPRKKSLSVTVYFTPKKLGNFFAQLPVIMCEGQNQQVYNYLTINGSSMKPLLESNYPLICFDPIMIGSIGAFFLTIKCINHFNKCKLSYETDIKNLSVEIEDETSTTSILNRRKKVVLLLNAVQTNCIKSSISFSCSCGSLLKIPISAVCDNCVLTTYSYLNMKADDLDALYRKRRSSEEFYNLEALKSEQQYPYFPSTNDNSLYAKKMRRTLERLENWIFTQGFYSKRFYRIPEDFCAFPIEIDAKKSQTKKTTPEFLPVVQFISNLAGEQFRRSLIIPHLEREDNLAQLNISLDTYVHVLKYLREKGAYLPNLDESSLLNYEIYLLYHQEIAQTPSPLDKEAFYLYSKQCWLDLILQTIKIFVLFRIEIPKSSLVAQMYSNHEMFLLKWLNVTYRKFAPTIWKNAEKIVVSRIDQDLSSGIVLGATTVAYCPYVKHLIEGMYAEPNTYEKKVHNNCVLMKTWKLLHIDFEITPLEFVDIDFVQIVLLLAHLYQVLPNYFPRETIAIKAPMSEIGEAIIRVTNAEIIPITYKGIFFGNEGNIFEIANENIKIKPKGNCKVTLKYTSKTVDHCKAILLLSSNVQRLGLPHCYNLEGIPDFAIPIQEIPVKIEIYKLTTLRTTLESPYQCAATYNVLYCYDPEPSSSTWHTSPKTIYFNETMDFDETGVCQALPSVCSLEVSVHAIWVAFVNPTIGGWVVRFNVKPRVSSKYCQAITVVLPKHYELAECTCRGRPDFMKHCPKIIHLKIPSKNRLLIQAMKDLFLLNKVQSDELDYWKKVLNTITGFHIMQFLLGMGLDSVTYSVRMDKNCSFTSVNRLKIDDVTDETAEMLPLHPIRHLEDGEFIRLNSLDGKEVRFYRVFFTETQ